MKKKIIVRTANHGKLEYIGQTILKVKVREDNIGTCGFLVRNNGKVNIIGMNIIKQMKGYSKGWLKKECYQDGICEEMVGKKKRSYEETLWDKVIIEYQTNVDACETPFYSGGKHHIRTKTDIPSTSKYRRIPPGQREEVKQHINGLIEEGIIEPSNSEYCSQMVIIKKKNRRY